MLLVRKRMSIGDFNPRTSCEVRPRAAFGVLIGLLNFNPRTSCEVRPSTDNVTAVDGGGISIHAPLARCDRKAGAMAIYLSAFQSTHLLRGATMPPEDLISTSPPFQSTHLLRGATFRHNAVVLAPTFQSTHLLRGATPGAVTIAPLDGFQSTHLLRGATGHHVNLRCRQRYFNPRTSCEVRHERADAEAWHEYFNPRTSCEVRHITQTKKKADKPFQSTHLLRGATGSGHPAA